MTSEPNDKKDNTSQLNKMGLGIALGIGVGVAIGYAMGNVGAGIAIGIALGIVWGTSLQRKNKSKKDDQ